MVPSLRSASRRHALFLAVLALAGIGVGLTTIVRARGRRAVAVVSRLGSRVRLLPEGISVSFLGLERRVLLPRADGAAVIEVPVRLPQLGGAGAGGVLRLHLEGSGALPLDAAAVRREGWSKAWNDWLATNLFLTPDDTRAALAATPMWREIFASPGEAAPLDLTARLAPHLGPLRLRRAELVADADPAVIRAAARQRLSNELKPTGRLIVLGLDALDWNLVDDLTRRGLMPNLSRLLHRAAQAVEEVPKPLISPVVWTTLATGEPPEMHGVLDFLESDPTTGTPRPVSGASRKAPALWEMAAAAGRSTAVIGWWATFPAQAPAGGVVYSDRLAEQLLGLQGEVPSLADPPEAADVARRLAMRAGDVTAAMLTPLASVRDVELDAARRGAGWDDPIGGLAKLWAATATTERLTDHELERGNDLVLAYFEGTDIVGHLFAPFRPPALSGTDPRLAARFAGVVDRYHQLLDAWIGTVVARLGPRDHLVIVSDHGFTWGSDRPQVPAGPHTATAEWWHRPEGCFIAVGPEVAHTSSRQRLGVLDVAPAILALAGLPRAAEMPGHVPRWLLAKAPTAAQPEQVRYAALVPPRAPARVELPPEAREEELSKLRALGYLAGGHNAAPPAAAPAELNPPPGAVPPSRPAPDRAEARRLTNLGTSRASGGDRTGGEQAFRQAIEADPTYAAAHYNLSLVLRHEGHYDEADEEFWKAVELGVREREMAVVQLALDYRERGELARARRVFEEGCRRFPDASPIWLNAGVFLGEQGDLQDARACLERAVRLTPGNPAAHRNLAAALLGLGERERARHELEECLRLDPRQGEVRRQLDALAAPQTH